jgi:hypothetical protein
MQETKLLGVLTAALLPLQCYGAASIESFNPRSADDAGGRTLGEMMPLKEADNA